MLAVAFDEDRSRVRKDNVPQNMAMLRHVALNLLKADKSTKVGIKTRRKMAGWSNAHLLGVKGLYQPRPRKLARAPRIVSASRSRPPRPVSRSS